jgi:hypothetical protein
MGDGGYARIRHGLVQDLIEQHGKEAYTIALQKMCHYEGDGLSQGMWRDVLNDLDEYFKQGEGQ